VESSSKWSVPPWTDRVLRSQPPRFGEPASLGFGGFSLGIADGLGHLAASCFAFLARLDALLHLRIIVSGTLGCAGLARLGARRANDGDQRAFSSHELSCKAAEFLAVDGQDGDPVMVGVTIFDLLEAVMERFVADRGARLARLETIAMQLVVMVGMLRSGLGHPQCNSCKAHPGDTENFATVHR